MKAKNDNYESNIKNKEGFGMEDGLEGDSNPTPLADHMKNGDVKSIMANFPEGTVTENNDDKNGTKPLKVNGEYNQDYQETNSNSNQDSYSSESDALVIDESVPKKKKSKGKFKQTLRRNIKKDSEEIISSPNESQDKVCGKINLETTKDFFGYDTDNSVQKVRHVDSDIASHNSFSDKIQTSDNFSANSDLLEPVVSKTHIDCDNTRIGNELTNSKELLTHSNPYFNESLFELSQLHHANEETSGNSSNSHPSSKEIASCNKYSKRVKPKPKLKEYAQYLGLQPAVQFKCPKCGKSGFESLASLQDHFLQCNAEQRERGETIENENISGFKLTRKVFLCSACGTYYENWNLYMHMLEYHRRYICLYCLGMFSILEDLCQHIQSRHNLEPGVKNTLEDFYNTYTEPCYVVCCECNRQFNEGDNFFYHNCVPSRSVGKNKTKTVKQVIAPENHVTGDSIMVPHESSDKDIETQEEVTQDMSESVQPKSMGSVDQECTGNQADSDKLNLIDADTSKQSISDLSENADESSSSLKENVSDSKEVDDKHDVQTENISKENCSDNALDCEQDSLDSTRLSEEAMENHPSTDNTLDEMDDNDSDHKDVGVHENEVETRKVPKLSLKLPKSKDFIHTEDSDYSDKADMEIDHIESEDDNEPEKREEVTEKDHVEETNEEEKILEAQYPVAGTDIPIIELELDQPLDKMDIRVLLQKCLQLTAPTCIYCNHSRRIAVNGKQLGLHAIAEHRYSAINKSITAEELIPESFNARIKECLDQLQDVFFNLESGVSEEAVTFSHVFECFQCHYSTTVHKELYLHNRKFHSKSLLLCIMCKSNFYSYSELICHLCPGVYILDYDLQFRCCMCISDDLPSSFRLMVHLRKRHNVCDVCLEMCHSQYKLSNHVWKHKLHHFCYRCGIAYRNKPDITRHLFWKHGTESVLCKKCLQKKWPHVYHFCVPPTSFTCEECNLIFLKAVSLKVHKRIHTEEKKHACTFEDCTETFISKKLMEKHFKRHTEPPEEEKHEEEIEDIQNNENANPEADKENPEEKDLDEPPKPLKPKVDVYDLPELNLSESDSSDSETEPEKPPEEAPADNTDSSVPSNIEAGESLPSSSKHELSEEFHQQEEKHEDFPQPVDDTSSSVMQDIWDNFKNYQANKEKLDNMFCGEIETIIDKPYVPDIPIPIVEEPITWEIALRDHDYCVKPENHADAIIEVKPALESTERVDHDYCFQSERDQNEKDKTKPEEVKSEITPVEPSKSPGRKRTSSSSSSSSGSGSSCACGSSCSCSDSSSDSSTSSSDSSNSDSSTEEGIKRQQQRRLKRKERKQAAKKENETHATESKLDVTSDQPTVVVEMPIHESDLETTESETDEEFYDREPQKFAKKILEEKRAQLLAEMGPNMVPNGSFIESTSRPPTPPAGTVEEEEQPKKKKKAKKRKKKKNEKRDLLEERTYSATLIMDSNTAPPIPAPPYYQQFHQMDRQSPTVAPLTLSLSRNSPAPSTPPLSLSIENPPALARQDSTASDTSLRASKRRRVPNKFYGYSSDEDGEKPKRSKLEINKTIPAPASPMLVPPLTIKTGPSLMALPPRPPMVEPITLRLPRPTHPPAEARVPRKMSIPPIRLFPPRLPIPHSRDESGSDSNDSDVEEPLQPSVDPAKPPQPQLYCYCRCPYDEVSEMIGCDSHDCEIEWFHFECVGIMVPPKGQWFCPDCRKKKQQQRRDLLS